MFRSVSNASRATSRFKSSWLKRIPFHAAFGAVVEPNGKAFLPRNAGRAARHLSRQLLASLLSRVRCRRTGYHRGTREPPTAVGLRDPSRPKEAYVPLFSDQLRVESLRRPG